jgi:hypothetical protein
LLAKEAVGWESADWNKCRKDWYKLLPTSFVQYPAPRIAQIKLAKLEFEGKQVANSTHLLEVTIVTLTLGTGGWRTFGIGSPLPPEQILLPHISQQSHTERCVRGVGWITSNIYKDTLICWPLFIATLYQTLSRLLPCALADTPAIYQ